MSEVKEKDEFEILMDVTEVFEGLDYEIQAIFKVLESF